MYTPKIAILSSTLYTSHLYIKIKKKKERGVIYCIRDNLSERDFAHGMISVENGGRRIEWHVYFGTTFRGETLEWGKNLWSFTNAM